MSSHASDQTPPYGHAPAHGRPSVPPEPPLNRRSLRTRAGNAKRWLLGLRPPRIGSQAWLEQQGMLTIGAHTYGKPTVLVFAGDCARVSIGRYCSLAAGIEIMPGGNHRIDTVTTYPMRQMLAPEGVERPGEPVSKGDVTIGNDVWIGRGAKILGGVSIGDGAVVAAWSVLTKSVPPYTIAAGVPARPVARRFSDDVVQSLLRIRWWDWEDALVRERIDELMSDDLEGFTRRYDPARVAQAAQTTSAGVERAQTAHFAA